MVPCCFNSLSNNQVIRKTTDNKKETHTQTAVKEQVWKAGRHEAGKPVARVQ